jgi:glutaredoxin-like protein NrdH
VGVAYEARDVDEDDRAYDELIALGLLSVPVTVVGERAVRGFDERAIREALEAAGVWPPDR